MQNLENAVDNAAEDVLQNNNYGSGIIEDAVAKIGEKLREIVNAKIFVLGENRFQRNNFPKDVFHKK